MADKKISTLLQTDARLKTVKQASKLLDEQFSIGGFKFGIDPLLNLIPVVGDLGSYIMSIALIITMAKHGASGKLVAKMVANATLDAFVGAIPVLGWIFDFTYKANTRNVKLLAAHYSEGKHAGSARPIVITIIVVTLILLILLIFVTIKLLQWIINGVDNTIGIKF